MAPSPLRPAPETVMGVPPEKVPPARSSVALLEMEIDATTSRELLPALIAPPPIVTDPVKPPVSMVRVLEPCLIRLADPLKDPELMAKELVLELTVMELGETVPVTVTLVGTPTVSSNNTGSLAWNTAGWPFVTLIQFVEAAVSQTPLLLFGLHCREGPTGGGGGLVVPYIPML